MDENLFPGNLGQNKSKNKMKRFIITKLKNSEKLLLLASYCYSFLAFLNVKGKNKNTIKYRGAFLKKTQIQIYGTNNSIVILPENRLTNCKLYIRGNNCKIIISKHCILSNIELCIEDNNGAIEIGYHTTMEGGHIAATEGKSITIGEDCMFSHRIEIRNGDSHAIFSQKSNLRINESKNVMIGNHVWLGADSKVLKGSIIEDEVIIAAGAIVVGITDKNSIYAGIPAKKIKEEIYWERERL